MFVDNLIKVISWVEDISQGTFISTSDRTEDFCVLKGAISRDMIRICRIVNAHILLQGGIYPSISTKAIYKEGILKLRK